MIEFRMPGIIRETEGLLYKISYFRIISNFAEGEGERIIIDTMEMHTEAAQAILTR